MVLLRGGEAEAEAEALEATQVVAVGGDDDDGAEGEAAVAAAAAVLAAGGDGPLNASRATSWTEATGLPQRSLGTPSLPM